MFNLLPKDTIFYDLFESLSQHVVSTAVHLQQLAGEFPNIEPHVQAIRREEHEADDLSHQALDRLDRTFITPFDREDIHALVGELDDIVDAVDALAKRFHLYHVKTIAPEFVQQTEVLVKATAALHEAVCRLRKSRKLSELTDKLIEIHRLENVGDENNHRAMSRLFEGGVEALEVIKWKGLLDLIEDAIDGCEDAGNTLERIVLKNG
jgi:predicted phosphate transport protein (TIGR00153 family)